MKKTIVTIILSALSLACPYAESGEAAKQSQPEVLATEQIKHSVADKDVTAWLKQELPEILKIKKGSTWEEIMKSFSPFGGIDAVNKRSFFYKKCNFIRIDVTFEDKDEKFDPKVKAISVSKSYLDDSPIPMD